MCFSDSFAVLGVDHWFYFYHCSPACLHISLCDILIVFVNFEFDCVVNIPSIAVAKFAGHVIVSCRACDQYYIFEVVAKFCLSYLLLRLSYVIIRIYFSMSIFHRRTLTYRYLLRMWSRWCKILSLYLLSYCYRFS